MERNDIIKALECCCSYCDKENCPYKTHDIPIACMTMRMVDALTLIKDQAEQIFKLENRLKECENGYEGTLFLDRCKLHDAEEKVKQLTEEKREIFEGVEKIINEPFAVGFSVISPLKQALDNYNNGIRKDLLNYVAELKKKYKGE